MGQRVNPIGLRLGINQNHKSIWFAKNKNEFKKFILDDYKIRKLINKDFRKAGISSILIARDAIIKLTIFAKLVGYIIGKQGAIINKLKARLENMLGQTVDINIKEVSRPAIDGMIVANDIASALEGKGSSFKMIVKKTMQSTMEAGAKGIKVLVGGRLGGSEIARKEPFALGSVPLQTLKANISYGMATAFTAAGTIGVKVWIFHNIQHAAFNPFLNMTDRFSQEMNANARRESKEESMNRA